MIEDDSEPSFLAWLNTLPQDQQTEWRLCLSDAYELEAREPAERAIYVTVGQPSDWKKTTPTVSLPVAVAHLQRPFLAIVEDSESDSSFLLQVASPEQRAVLLNMLRTDGLQFEHGGGISNMPRRLESLLAHDGDHLRLWAMFDSDAMQPGQSSADADRLAAKCESVKIPFHRLQRRAIENYLPDKALEHWAWSSPKPARKKIIRAFRRLTPEQRWHFNMKGGFGRDEKRQDASSEGLYEGIPEADQLTLAHGFGDDIAEMFAKVGVTPEELEQDGSRAELSRMIHSLIKLLR